MAIWKAKIFIILFISLLFVWPVLAQSSYIFGGTLDSALPANHLAITQNPAITLAYQTTITRTGAGAYHAIGGNITSGDADIINSPAKNSPLGGLEVWTGGAFRFEAFPDNGNIWIMVTVPTDGIIGANNKPTAMITPEGRLRLGSSNPINGQPFGVDSQTVLETGRWYYLIIHGLNGTNANQQLLIYDDTDTLIETLNLAWTVDGSYKNRVAKWGFGTSQDSTGLEYYLDDLSHFRGSDNPGPQCILQDHWQ